MLNFILLQFSQSGYFMLLAGLFFFPLIISVITVKDIFYNDNIEMKFKLVWILIVCIIPLLGAMVYYLWGKPNAANKNL